MQELSRVSEATRDLAKARFRLIQPYLEEGRSLQLVADDDATSIAGHSLRAGMATQAALNGAEEREIARTTGHHSEAMVRRYIRMAGPFQAIAATQLGL